MHFELHITINTNNIEKFVDDCKTIGVKPIVIEVENKGLYRQVMTSSKHEEITYEDTLKNLKYQLEKFGYQVIRQKVEIMPDPINKNENFIYYESHMRLKLSKDFDRSILIALCKQHQFHLSKNLFKVDKEYNYQMITFRSYDKDYHTFIEVINTMKYELDQLNINYDKVEIEECILDSNETIDTNWLN